MWQDYVIAIVGLLFSYSLIPQIIKIFKDPKLVSGFSWQTVVITTVGLLILSICMFTLTCYLSAFTNLITCLCWAIILVEKIIMKIRKEI